MAVARVLVALLASLQGLLVPAIIYPDVDDADCTISEACSANSIVDVERGLCIAPADTTGNAGPAATAGNKQCWDACNPAHAPLDYVKNYNMQAADIAAGIYNPIQKGIALMVKQFRTGQRGQNSCPGTAATSVCNPGERCTPPGLTWGRGMCTLKEGQGNVCLDMCDTTILETSFKSPGKEAGTIQTVRMVRAGRDQEGLTTCPGPSIWHWLWFPLLLCCCVGFCALAYYLYSYYRQRLKKYKGGNDSSHAFIDEDVQPYVDYNQVAPQPYIEEPPMPVLEPMQPMEDILPPLEPMGMPPMAMEQNIFGTPNLLRNPSAPQTVAMPMGTNLGGFPTVPSGSMFGGGSMATGMPQYGAYGAYGQPGAAFPTGSMRIA